MKLLQLIAVALGLLLLAAHLSRAGLPVAAALLLGLIPLVAVRRPWAGRLLQVVLALGALEWLRTTVNLARLRLEAEAPFLRLVLILGAVAAFTGATALAFQGRRLRRHFRLDRPEPGDPSDPP